MKRSSDRDFAALMVRVCTLLVFAACAFASTGCGSPIIASTPESELIASGKYEIVADLDVPKVEGPDGCGAQALATVLTYSRNSDENGASDAAIIAKELPWHDYGATPVDLLLEARSRGADATIERGSWERLRAEIETGRPALVMLDVGYEVRTLVARYPTGKIMHWSVASGIAHDDSSILLAATNQRHHVVDRKEFLRRWEKSDCCMIVVETPKRPNVHTSE